MNPYIGASKNLLYFSLLFYLKHYFYKSNLFEHLEYTILV